MQERQPPSSGHTTDTERSPVLAFPEFVALMALMMALTALSIDIMLPSLPQIAAAFAVPHPNDAQQIVTGYMLGLSLGQLAWGPVSDRFGRKGPLLLGLLVFAAGSVMSIVVTSFSMLLWARMLQGFGGAAARVISVAIVRDLYAGRQMARVMSIVMMVFITVPVLAPTIGQALAHIGSWRWAFYVLLAVAAIGIAWVGVRLPETALESTGQAQSVIETSLAVVRARTTLWYSVASGFMFGALVSYIVSAQQVFVDVFALGDAFPIAFGALACSIAVASFVNSQLVQRLGMRRLSHLALVWFIAASVLLAGISLVVQPPLLLFGLLMAAAFFGFGLVVPNFNAIAMQPMARMAGMASSLIGFFTSGVGVVIGWIVGRLFDGSVRPLSMGFALLGASALLCVLAVEGPKGMFRGE